MKLKRRLFHLHHDPGYQMRGVTIYEQCPCGARRVTRMSNRLSGPVDQGWPQLIDANGVPRQTSGWVNAPPDGWPVPS